MAKKIEKKEDIVEEDTLIADEPIIEEDEIEEIELDTDEFVPEPVQTDSELVEALSKVKTLIEASAYGKVSDAINDAMELAESEVIKKHIWQTGEYVSRGHYKEAIDEITKAIDKA